MERQAIDKLASVFDDKVTDAQVVREAEVTKLHAKIGQLVVECTTIVATYLILAAEEEGTASRARFDGS